MIGQVPQQRAHGPVAVWVATGSGIVVQPGDDVGQPTLVGVLHRPAAVVGDVIADE